jgi:hypothetical protein
MRSTSLSKVTSASPMPRCAKVVVAARPPPSKTGTFANIRATCSRAWDALPPALTTLPQAAR